MGGEEAQGDWVVKRLKERGGEEAQGEWVVKRLEESGW